MIIGLSISHIDSLWCWNHFYWRTKKLYNQISTNNNNNRTCTSSVVMWQPIQSHKPLRNWIGHFFKIKYDNFIKLEPWRSKKYYFVIIWFSLFWWCDLWVKLDVLVDLYSTAFYSSIPEYHSLIGVWKRYDE